MFTDPHALRALARGLGDQAATVHEEAALIRRTTRAVLGTGLTVDAMCGASGDRADELDRTARQLDRARRELLRHAALVEDLVALIAEIERRVERAVAGAVRRVEQLASKVIDTLDPFDHQLASFVPPPPGDPAWLAVHLPGVALPPVPVR